MTQTKYLAIIEKLFHTHIKEQVNRHLPSINIDAIALPTISRELYSQRKHLNKSIQFEDLELLSRTDNSSIKRAQDNFITFLSTFLVKEEWFEVIGFYGGFSYSLVETDNQLKLYAFSHSRIVSFSERGVEISTDGVKIVY